jgi:ribose-phosphate pyrophosphokinase
MRNIVVLGGSSHPQLTETICNHLGIPKAKVLLDKFKGGETRVEIEESVRGKDVFIIQSGGGKGTKPPWRIVTAIVILS